MKIGVICGFCLGVNVKIGVIGGFVYSVNVKIGVIGVCGYKLWYFGQNLVFLQIE